MMGLRAFWLSAAALVFSLGTTGAKGEVIYRTNLDRDNKLIDLDSNGTADFRFWWMPDISMCEDCLSSTLTAVDGFSTGGLLVSGFDAARVTDGTTIGALAPPDSSWENGFESHSLSTYRDFYGWSGDWDHLGEGMIGVSFVSELGQHYGWIRLKLGGEFVPGEFEPGIIGLVRAGPIVESWAYESTPNTPIMAGAVPEAGTVVLGVAGCMMLVLGVWRRRSFQRIGQALGLLIVVVFVSADANGEVIYQTNADRDNKLIDLDSNGAADFQFWSMQDFTDCVGCFSVFTGVDGFNTGGLIVSGTETARLANGVTIGAAAPPATSWEYGFDTHALSTYRDHSGWNGTWDHSGEGMIGVSFESELGRHYGWMRLKLGNDILLHQWEPGVVGYIRIGPIVESWAYESTPGSAIVAGAVPEAGTVVLWAVGGMMLVLGVGWRRRVRRTYSHTECADDVG